MQEQNTKNNAWKESPVYEVSEETRSFLETKQEIVEFFYSNK